MPESPGSLESPEPSDELPVPLTYSSAAAANTQVSPIAARLRNKNPSHRTRSIPTLKPGWMIFLRKIASEVVMMVYMKETMIYRVVSTRFLVGRCQNL